MKLPVLLKDVISSTTKRYIVRLLLCVPATLILNFIHIVFISNGYKDRDLSYESIPQQINRR